MKFFGTPPPTINRPVTPALILMSVSSEVRDGIECHVMAAALHRIDLMLDEAEARRAVGEGGAEDRHVMLIGELHEAVFLLAVLRQPLAHFADERARGIDRKSTRLNSSH